jgi:hypothetical protein
VTPAPTYASIKEQIKANREKIEASIAEARAKYNAFLAKHGIATLPPGN